MFDNDVLHPVEYWNNKLDAQLKKEIESYYQNNIIKKAKVNYDACVVSADEIHELDKQIKKVENKTRNARALMIFLIVLGVIGFVAGVVGLALGLNAHQSYAYYFIIPLLVGPCLFGLSWLPKKSLKANTSILEEKNSERAKKYSELQKILAPIYGLINSEITFEIFQKLYPTLNFDSFLSQKNSPIWDKYLWHDKDVSVLKCFSGAIKNNPFIVLHCKRTGMFPFVYTGTVVKTVWRTVRINGRSSREAVPVTVTATVTLPAPKWWDTVSLFYLNNAAPELNFKNFKEFRNDKEAIKYFTKNEKMAPMDNPEFDKCFPCQRNDEVGFRTLFSPLAQENIVNLFKVRNDYKVAKNKLLTRIDSDRFNGNDLNYSLSMLKTEFDIRIIEQMFNDVIYGFIKTTYWMFAPLLSIPLYQQYEGKWKQPTKEDAYSTYENEGLVNNAYDPTIFNHPQCATQNILKCTNQVVGKDNTQTVTVTAHGHRTVHRVQMVTVNHPTAGVTVVPVPVIDYYPVQKDSIVYNSYYEKSTNDFNIFNHKVLKDNNVAQIYKFGNLVTARTTSDKQTAISLNKIIEEVEKKFI